MALFRLKNLNGTISEFNSHKEYCDAKGIERKKLVKKLFNEKENHKVIGDKIDSVYNVEYRDYTILIIYGGYSDAFGMVLKNENPICVLDLFLTGEEVVNQGIEKISLIQGNFFPEFDIK